MATMRTGTIMWHDLTVPDAENVRDFYQAVAGWRAEAVDMGGYSDYTMYPGGAAEGSAPSGGICHAHGSNSGLPPQWLIYIIVESIAASIEKCVALGGSVVDGPREMGTDLFAVIKDPAGACVALYEQGARD